MRYCRERRAKGREQRAESKPSAFHLMLDDAMNFDNVTQRAVLLIKGIVQGVGFRPFIYKLANTHNLKGWVLNSTEGVSIDVEGEDENVKGFIDNIRKKAPPLAVIDSVDVSYLSPAGYTNFIIKPSQEDSSKYMKISPDICICDDCLTEIFDPDDRRYLYPFTNCTNCGPRFTIIEGIPYDREKTTMKAFKMCQFCQSEYDNPTNRRFHAQPNACPDCGPHVYLESLEGKIECHDPIKKAIELMSQGKIIAIKGLGGFHLACDAENDDAVRLLRIRKRRSLKPFAIMCKDVETIRRFCVVDEDEKRLLRSVQRPIVLLEKLPGNFRKQSDTFAPNQIPLNPPLAKGGNMKSLKGEARISEFVAPNNNYLGVMLPYTPLHYLLLDSLMSALVMTSANMSEEPIVIGNDEAKERLAGLTDYFLFHNRDIRMRCDDSVARVYEGQTMIIRRSRGYAPYPVDLDFSMKEILACGAELKNTFCITRDNHAFVSHHIGDLQNSEAYGYYLDSIEHYKMLFRINPEILAYDLHPDYLSTKYALSQTGKKLIGVQHHHAHIASCMAENGLDEKVIGIALDGTGYGIDGNIWGCEFLLADYAGFQRRAHLKYLPMPGGDMVAKEPYRMALSYLYDAYEGDLDSIDTLLLKRIDNKKIAFIKSMIEKNINTPLTSSCGRLFDAVSSLIGVRDVVTYEAQAAIELEMIAEFDVHDRYNYEIIDQKEMLIIDTKRMFQEIIYDLRQGLSKGVISAKFHNTLADFMAVICEEIRKANNGINKVVLSGGVFQNKYLLTNTIKLLKNKGFITYFHNRIPTNDGGISLGQGIIANAQL